MIECFSVRSLVPFVCQNDLQNCPFICNKKPLIRNYGFTLVELIITMVIAGVLLGIAVPSFQNFIRDSRITSQSNEFIGVLSSARSEAIKRNKTVVLCRSANPTATTPGCVTGGSFTWETGWLVFQDTDGNNDFTTAGADILIYSHEPVASGNTLRGNNSQVGNAVTFSRDGLTTLTSPAAGDPPHHFKLCDTRGANSARALVLETTGRARIDRKATFAALACP